MSAAALFRQVEVLDSERHRDLRLTLPADMGFARGLRDCPVLVDEFFEAAKHYPIVFARLESGELMAAAVLGWPDTGNLWVDASGAWRHSAYVPAYVRRYPFVVVSKEHENYVGVDLAYAGWSTSVGVPLFNEEGEISEQLQRAGLFLEEYLAGYARTQAYLGELYGLGLLQPFVAELGDGAARQRLDNLLCVNRRALESLPAQVLQDFVRSGHYALTVAHHMSLTNFSALGQR